MAAAEKAKQEMERRELEQPRKSGGDSMLETMQAMLMMELTKKMGENTEERGDRLRK